MTPLEESARTPAMTARERAERTRREPKPLAYLIDMTEQPEHHASDRYMIARNPQAQDCFPVYDERALNAHAQPLVEALRDAQRNVSRCCPREECDECFEAVAAIEEVLAQFAGEGPR